jgi:hypothetical protein
MLYVMRHRETKLYAVWAVNRDAVWVPKPEWACKTSRAVVKLFQDSYPEHVSRGTWDRSTWYWDVAVKTPFTLTDETEKT